MRNRWTYFQPVCGYLGLLLGVFGFLMFVPVALQVAYTRAGRDEVSVWVFLVPIALAWVLGFVFKRNFRLVDYFLWVGSFILFCILVEYL